MLNLSPIVLNKSCVSGLSGFSLLSRATAMALASHHPTTIGSCLSPIVSFKSKTYALF